MARTYIAYEPWGTYQDPSGNALIGLAVTLKNKDGTAATHYSAETGGTSSTGAMTTDSNGQLARYVETGEYLLNVASLGIVDKEVHAVSGDTLRVVAEAPRNVQYPEYGAVGDGSADDTAAFTAAGSAGDNTYGVPVYAPPGEYRVQGVDWYERGTWHGAGNGRTVISPVSSASTTPMFNAVATAQVTATDRFTYGGFHDIEFDGLDETGNGVAISTYDLQDVAAVDAATGLYTWLQQLHFERCVFTNLKIGLELWGDCRTVPILGNRFLDCDTGIFVAHNHPNIRHNSIRDCRIGIDVTAMLDCEIIGTTISQCDYGLGGASGRTDRFGQAMGKIDRSRIIGCIFYQNWALGARMGVQNQFNDNFVWMDHATTGTGTTTNASNSITSLATSTGTFKVGQIIWGTGIPTGTTITGVSGTTLTISANATASGAGVALSAAGVALQVKGGGNSVLGNWLIEFDGSKLIDIVSGTSGAAESVGLKIEHNKLTLAGGGRAINKTTGTDDYQEFVVHGNEFQMSAVPADGNGGAAIYWPASVGNVDRPQITSNTIRTTVAQTDHVVKILATTTHPHKYIGNDHWSVVAGSKGFKITNSTNSIIKDNQFTNFSSGTDTFDLGTTNSSTILRDNPGYALPNVQLGQFGWKTGRWYVNAGTAATGIPAEGAVHATPLMIPAGETLDRVAVEVTIVGTAGAVIRLGVYDDDGDFFPGTLLTEASSTVDATVLGITEKTLASAITAGAPKVLWLAAVVQGGAGTRPTMRLTSNNPLPGMGGLTSAVLQTVAVNGYVANGPFAGALSGASPYPSGSGVGTSLMRVAARAA